MRFIQPPWENYFLSRIQTLESSLLLVSPYIKYLTAALIYAVLQRRRDTSLSIQILTRINIQDLNEGASDLEAFEQLLQLSELPGIDGSMKYISNLHAKVYIFDHSSAIITSSNLTPSGMKSNIEYGIELTDSAAVQQIRSEMNKYWTNAEIVTPEIIKQIKASIEAVTVSHPGTKQDSALSTNKAVSSSVPIISKRLVPQGQDIEFMELENLRENILSTRTKRRKETEVVGRAGGKRALDVPKRTLDDKSGETRKRADESLEEVGTEMILMNITTEHIRQAISKLRASQLPVETTMGNHVVRYAGRDYSPRKILSLSNEYANGEYLDMSGFRDVEVERFLKKRGFSITGKSEVYTPVELPRPREGKSLPLQDRIFAQRYGYSPGKPKKAEKKVLSKSKRRKLNRKLIHQLSDAAARRARRKKRR